MVSGFMTYLSVHSMKPRNLSTWFHGFDHSISGTLKWRQVSWFHGFMVSWFRPLHLWMTRSLQVSWFHGFVVSWFRPLRLWMARSRQVSWFRPLHVQSISGTLKRRQVSWFRGFVVSWFHPIHLWDIEKMSGFMVSWFRGFVVSSNPSLGHC